MSKKIEKSGFAEKISAQIQKMTGKTVARLSKKREELMEKIGKIDADLAEIKKFTSL